MKVVNYICRLLSATLTNTLLFLYQVNLRAIMKKIILPLLLSAPTFLFAKTSDDTEIMIGIFLGLVIFIAVFFLFRALLLWYWRNNDMVKNQEEKTQLLRNVVRNLESENDQIKK